ncbi:hypothetical protein KEJ18_01655 [Candidatus Bathyarchaeota archaeon]|nr:hypothetical protein [Candidatus Bathyarchaeota archaeon]
MEFLVLTSQQLKQPEREQIIMQAVIEAAETMGIERITKRKGNVYCIGVYFSNGETKSLLYNDWEKNWDRKKIYNCIVSSIQNQPMSKKEELILTIA